MTDDAQLVRQIALAAIELAEAARADVGATSDLRRMLARAGNPAAPPRVDQEPKPGENRGESQVAAGPAR